MTSHDFGVVVQSYDLGVVRAIEYLMEQKDGGIAFIENEVWPGRNMVLEVMRETYLDLMRRKRPGFGPLVLPQARGQNLNELRGQGVTGFFCCDDVSAIRTIGRIREQGGSVPEEFNVVSYGNTDLSRFFTPSITSVDPHHAEMAAILAEILLAEHAPTNQQYVVQPELVVRDT
jgi:DNA-binding LacI/PurR family transcriptional regulator